jgi:hypothetical protein
MATIFDACVASRNEAALSIDDATWDMIKSQKMARKTDAATLSQHANALRCKPLSPTHWLFYSSLSDSLGFSTICTGVRAQMSVPEGRRIVDVEAFLHIDGHIDVSLAHLARVGGLGSRHVTVTVNAEEVNSIIPICRRETAFVLSVKIDKHTPRKDVVTDFCFHAFAVSMFLVSKVRNQHDDLYARLFKPLIVNPGGERHLVLHVPPAQALAHGGAVAVAVVAVAPQDNAALLDVGSWR